MKKRETAVALSASSACGSVRDLILAGAVRTAARVGYSSLTVAQVVGEAKVGRSTFYGQFTDLEVCFLAALGQITTAVEEAVVAGACKVDRGSTAMSVIGPLLDFAIEDEAAARCLLVESLGAGPRALELRDGVCQGLAKKLASDWSGTPEREPRAAMAAEVLIGGAVRLLAMRLRHGSNGVNQELAEGLRSWIRSYVPPSGDPPWAPFPTLAARAEAPRPPVPVMPRPHGLQPGRQRLSRGEVAHNQRERIMAAIAQLAHAEGYAELSVSRVVGAAGVSRNVFYAQFRDLTEAATEAHELFFQHAMTAAAGAFFREAEWPDRVWAAGRALLEFIAAHPAEAHLGFVESHAVGTAAIQVAYDRLEAFGLFLEEGYGRLPEETPLSRVTSHALAAVMFELVYRELRRTGGVTELPRRLPGLVYMNLAPFLGADEARRFVQARLAREGSPG